MHVPGILADFQPTRTVDICKYILHFFNASGGLSSQQQGLKSSLAGQWSNLFCLQICASLSSEVTQKIDVLMPWKKNAPENKVYLIFFCWTSVEKCNKVYQNKSKFWVLLALHVVLNQLDVSFLVLLHTFIILSCDRPYRRWVFPCTAPKGMNSFVAITWNLLGFPHIARTGSCNWMK
jgi:hypothetical protein